jgi:hypothetical protein
MLVRGDFDIRLCSAAGSFRAQGAWPQPDTRGAETRFPEIRMRQPPNQGMLAVADELWAVCRSELA